MKIPGNPKITEAALRELHPEVTSWALFCCNYDRDEAAEIVQRTYLKIVEGRARFHGRSSLKTWLFGVVRFTSRESQHHWRLRAVGEVLEEGHEGLDIDHLMQQKVARAMGQLSAAQREVAYLVFHRDQTLAEAAVILGVSVGTVRVHYHRAKVHLRQTLRGEEQDGRVIEKPGGSLLRAKD